MIEIKVWEVDHVLLSPRSLELPIGRRKQIVAEVTSAEGERSTDVILNWKHSADDQLMVRIGPTGFVTGNRLGTTEITAGTGSEEEGVWARIPSVVEVVPSEEREGAGEGKPRLLITGKDKDPDTGEIRDGDSEEPVLWQLPSDFRNNVWWLNLEAPEARHAFAQREDNMNLWRMFHAGVLVDMVVQVHMHADFTARGDAQRRSVWATYKQAMETAEVKVSPAMWEKLEDYISEGGKLEAV